MLASSSFLQQEGYLVTILGFIALMLAPYGAAFYQSRKVVKKLGTPNGEGSSLFDVGQNAAKSAERAKDAAELVATAIDQNFLLIFNRLTQQDQAISTLKEHLGVESGSGVGERSSPPGS